MIPGWIAHPDKVDAQVAEWSESFPHTFTAESFPQYAGRPVWALSVTDKCAPSERKKRILIDKPHAHEPAPIAGQANVINMLLTGESLDGRPTEFDNDRVLHDCLITFLIDANPQGTASAPVECWDGSKYTNDEFWAWMRGVDPDTGLMWKRVDLWDDTKEEKLPTRYGIVYEQVSEHEYVEPNRHHRSSLFRWLYKLWDRYPWDWMLSLHQTEFVNSDRNCMVIMPCAYDDQPPQIQQAETAWGEAVVAAWQSLEGARPIEKVEPLNYTGEQRDYLVKAWGDFSSRVPMLTTEIQNNSTTTPPFVQMRLNEVALRATVEHALA